MCATVRNCICVRYKNNPICILFVYCGGKITTGLFVLNLHSGIETIKQIHSQRQNHICTYFGRPAILKTTFKNKMVKQKKILFFNKENIETRQKNAFMFVNDAGGKRGLLCLGSFHKLRKHIGVGRWSLKGLFLVHNMFM